MPEVRFAAVYRGGVKVNTANRSQEPVYDVEVRMWRRECMIWSTRASLIAPTESWTAFLPRAEWLDLSAQADLEQRERLSGASLEDVMRMQAAGPPTLEEQARGVVDPIRIEVTFTDSAGRRWTRDRSGILSRA